MLDFVNVGFKGISREVYCFCGVINVDLILRNIRMIHEKGIYIEVFVIYCKNGE